MTEGGTGPATRPVLIAYDGSDPSRLAIAEAGQLIGSRQAALVVCVWQPFDVGFLPVGGRALDAEESPEVRAAAEETAAAGADLARRAGFDATSLATQASPIWKGIVDAADDHDARLVVIGSRGRSGLIGRLVGSVAGAVVAHTGRTVLVCHRDT